MTLITKAAETVKIMQFLFFGSDKLCDGKQYGDSRYNGKQWFYTIVTDILRQLQVQAQGLYSAYNNHSYGCGWIIAAWGKACFYGIYVFYSDFYRGKENVKLWIYNMKDSRKGNFILVCGMTGSGKTTLLKKLKEYFKDNAMMVMQNPDNQIIMDSVYGELAVNLSGKGLKDDFIKRRIAETASFFHSATCLTKEPIHSQVGKNRF